MATKIMIQLRKKYKETSKDNFDTEIAALFNNASRIVNELAKDGKYPACDLDFWAAPKVGTVFEYVSDNTVYRFAVKLLEAREAWLARGHIFSVGFASHKCKAANAIDCFNEDVEVAELKTGGAAVLMDEDYPGDDIFPMKSYLIDQFNESEDTDDTDEEEDLSDESDDEAPAAEHAKGKRARTADDDVEAPTAKRVKFTAAGGFAAANSAASSALGKNLSLPLRVRDSEVSGVTNNKSLSLPLRGHAPEVSDVMKDKSMSVAGDYGPILAKLAKEGEAQRDEEAKMEMDGY